MNNWEDFVAKPVDEQKDILKNLHYVCKLTTAEIAGQFNTYANKVRRYADKIGFEFRNRSEAQSLVLKSGKANHPTEGRERTKEEKKKIGKKVADSWNNISEEEKERRAEIARENWNNKSAKEIEMMHKMATAKRLEAAKDGSKLENYVVQELINAGFEVESQKEHMLLNERVHIDVWLPQLNTAIEVDGPTHFMPIWGEEHLKKTQATDNMKDGLLLNSGFCIIRLRQKKNLSQTYASKLVSDLLEILNKIQLNYPKPGERRIIIGEN